MGLMKDVTEEIKRCHRGFTEEEVINEFDSYINTIYPMPEVILHTGVTVSKIWNEQDSVSYMEEFKTFASDKYTEIEELYFNKEEVMEDLIDKMDEIYSYIQSSEL